MHSAIPLATEFMSAIFILVGASLLVAIGFLAAFIWSVKSGQYEDDYTPSIRILFENKKGAFSSTSNKKNNHNLWNSKNLNTTTKS